MKLSVKLESSFSPTISVSRSSAGPVVCLCSSSAWTSLEQDATPMQALYNKVLTGLADAALGKKEGEQLLEAAKRQPGFTVCLAQAVLQADAVPVHVRHLASILLKQFVDEQWVLSTESDPRLRQLLEQKRARERDFEQDEDEFDASKAKESATPLIGIQEAEKAEIRRLLIGTLALPEAPIRGSCAIVCASIARFDVPGTWPELWPALQAAISGPSSGPTPTSDSPGQDGAMLCLEMLVHPDCLPNDVLEQLLTFVLPFVLQVYTARQAFPVRIRRRCVSILFSLINWIANYRGETGRASSGMMPLLLQVLPQWLEQFLADLSVPNDQNVAETVSLKIVILQVCCILVYSLFDQLAATGFLQRLLVAAWQHLQAFGPLFARGLVHSDDLHGGEEVDFNCGDTYTFENLVLMVLEFFHATLGKEEARRMLGPQASDLVYTLAFFSQLTHAQREEYEFDPDQFAIDEQDEVHGAHLLSIRVSSAKLMAEIAQTFSHDASVRSSIVQALQKRVEESEASRGQGEWWLLREGLLYALTKSLKHLAPSEASSRRGRKDATALARFPVGPFVALLVKDVEEGANAYLRGRALSCASVCAKSMEGEVAPSPDPRLHFFQAAARALDPAAAAPFPAKIGACRALKKFCALADEQTMRQVVGYLANGLCAFVEEVTAGTLTLVLDVFVSILTSASKKCPDAMEPLTEVVIMCVMKVWLAHSQDAFLNSFVTDILLVLLVRKADQPTGLSAQQCAVLQKHCLPIMAEVIGSPEAVSEKITALELLDIFLRAAAPVPSAAQGLASMCLPGIFQFLCSDACTNEYDSVYDVACKLFVTCLLHVRPEGVTIGASWDAVPQAALEAHATLLCLQPMLQFASKLLDPSVSEMAIMRLGNLLSLLIVRFSRLLSPLLPQILQAVSQRFLVARMSDIQESLLTVVARMVLMDPTAVVGLLQQSNALEGVMSLWCKKQQEFYGRYCKAVTMAAFCSLLAADASPVRLLQVPGDRLAQKSRYSLRSSKNSPAANVEQWTVVAMPVKMAKLLLAEVALQRDLQAGDDLDGDEDEFYDDLSDDLLEGDDDDFYLVGDDDFGDEEEMGMDFDCFMEEGVGSAQFDKELLAADLAVAGPLLERLTAFFQQCKAGSHPAVAAIASQLSADEQGLLASC